MFEAETHQHLRFRFAVFFRDFPESRVTERFAAAERRPRFDDESVLFGKSDGFQLVRVRETEMIFQLIDGGHNLAFAEKHVEMTFQAVTNPDCAHTPLCVKFFEGAPRRKEGGGVFGFEIFRNRPMDEVEVDGVQPQFFADSSNAARVAS